MSVIKELFSSKANGLNIKLFEYNIDDEESYKKIKDYLINRVRKVMNQIKKESDFYGKEDRFLFSPLAFLITVDGQDAGFIYFLNEDNKTSKILFVYIAILNEYKRKKVAYTYMREILDNKELINNRFVLAEVEEYNLASQNLLEKLRATKVADKHFLLQPAFSYILQLNQQL